MRFALLLLLATAALAKDPILFSFFRNNGEDGLYLAASVWASTVKGRFPATAGQGNRDYNHRLYSFRSRDFVTLSKPELFYDPGFQVIDGAVFKFGRRYALVAKNETLKPEAKYLFMSFADSPRGPWTPAGVSISGKEWAEGPAPVRIGAYWYIYFDKYRDHRYGVIRSKDLVEWEDLSSQLSFPPGARHGTAFRAPRAVLRGLEGVVAIQPRSSKRHRKWCAPRSSSSTVAYL